MAITRKDVREILENESLSNEERASALLNLTHAETDSLRDSIDELNQKITSLEADVQTANDGKTSAENALTQFKTDIEQKQTNEQKQMLFRQMLTEAGIPDKRINAVLKASDLSTINVENGAISDRENIMNNIKTEWAEFIPSTSASGAPTPNPPATNPQTFFTREEISRMSAAEINKNWDAVNASLKHGG